MNILSTPVSALDQARSDAPHVHILMCTHNGAQTLREQLDSFEAQDHQTWSLWVSDDKSTDDSLRILEDYIAHHPEREVHILAGKGQGLAANYLSLLCHPDLPPGFVALSDQDDVWLPSRLSRALGRIKAVRATSPDLPTLYGSRTYLTNEHLDQRRASRRFNRPPSFRNALVQNVMSGNTLMLDPAALALVRLAGPQQGLPFHDWWLYQLIAGAGGNLIRDDQPGVLYRQHGGNTLGAHRGLDAALMRLRKVMNREFRDWVDSNVQALTACRSLLTEPHQRELLALATRHDGGRLTAIARVNAAGIHRQSRMQSALLYWAMLTGRL